MPVIKLRRPNPGDSARKAAALAKAIGIHRATVARIYSGDALPGTTFIAAMLAAYPDKDFEDLFTVEDDEREVPA